MLHRLELVYSENVSYIMSAKRGKITDFFTKVRAKLSRLTYKMYNQNTLGYNAVVGLPKFGLCYSTSILLLL